MKILHTSDWHLGQHFYNKSRASEHQAFLDWLLTQIEQHDVDALIVAGDVFDTTSPPSYAREMYNQFAVRLAQLNCTQIVLGGNHDSVSVLNENKELLKLANTHVIANTLVPDEEQIVSVKNSNGEVIGLVCAIPFIRPQDVTVSKSGDSAQDKEKALSEAIKAHYQSVYQRALNLQESLSRDSHSFVLKDVEPTLQGQENTAAANSEIAIKNEGKKGSEHLGDNKANQKHIPIIATGHLTALGAKKSESERDIYVGALKAFDSTLFPPADYIALGHIHRPQMVGGNEYIRYCGSPIPLSFDEVNTQKQVNLVEFTTASSLLSEKSGINTQIKNTQISNTQITKIEIPSFQTLKTIEGTVASVESQLDKLAEISADESVWLKIVLNEQNIPADITQRLNSRVADTGIEILCTSKSNARVQSLRHVERNETLEHLTPKQVFEKRLSEKTEKEEEISTDEQDKLIRVSTLFNKVLEDVSEQLQTAQTAVEENN